VAEDSGNRLDPASFGKPGSQTGASNRGVRVFVSSTFRDMMEERDALMTHTWPELRVFCRERQVEVVEVDLRWGIAEEQSTRNETLRLCLDEIRACRPFFIGLLGERYGSAPGREDFTQDLQEEYPWIEGLLGKGYTEIEILHGVLNDPSMAGRAFFYFRDPAYSLSCGPDFCAESDESAGKQRTLKASVRAACEAANLPLTENYSDPHTLATLVLHQLKAAIEARFPLKSVPDPLTREARYHEAFAETRRRTYIERPDYYETLDRHARNQDGPLVIFGQSGGGKSALLANWLAQWKRDHTTDVIFQHYIGATADSADHGRLIARLIAEIKRWTGDLADVPGRLDDLRKDLPLWLAKARIKADREGVRVIVVLDALNQLTDQEHARLMAWLPTEPFRGLLRLVVSTLPGETLQALEDRSWTTLCIEPLTQEERKRMIAAYLKRFGKTLDARRLERLAAEAPTANPLYLKTLLDELRVTGTHERLDQRLAEYLKAADIPALLRQVLERYGRDYERERIGLVEEALSLIWAARRGLTETELLRLLRPPNLPQMPMATWSPLRAALEGTLVDCGGVLAFANDYMRATVGQAFLADDGKRQHFRLSLAGYFEQEPVSARSCDELPWLLRETNERTRLRSCLLDIERFLIIFERDENELSNGWVWLHEEREMGKPYVAAFDEWSAKPGQDRERVSRAAGYLGHFLCQAGLLTDAEPILRTALRIHESSPVKNDPKMASVLTELCRLLLSTNQLSEAEQCLRRALEIDEAHYGEGHPKVGRDLANLAGTLGMSQRWDEAETLQRRALKIAESTLGENHPDFATALQNLGVLLQNTGREEEAEPLLRRALQITESSLGKDDPAVAPKASNLATLLVGTGRVDEAEILLRRALVIRERSSGPDHPDVAADLNNLGQVLGAANRPGEAVPLLRRALRISEETFGGNHLDVALKLQSLAEALRVTHHLDEAAPLLWRALDIKASHLGQVHPEIQSDYAAYCGLTAQIEHEAALRLHVRSAEESYGEGHFEVAAKLTDLALFLQASGGLEEAELLMRRAISITERSPDSGPASLAVAINNLAGVLQAAKRFSEAEALFRQALQTAEDHSPQSYWTAMILNNLAMLLREVGRSNEAEPLICRAVEIFQHLATTSGKLHENFEPVVQSYIELLQSIGWDRDQIRTRLRSITPDFALINF
jgi:nephrocystin-3